MVTRMLDAALMTKENGRLLSVSLTAPGISKGATLKSHLAEARRSSFLSSLITRVFESEPLPRRVDCFCGVVTVSSWQE